MLGLRVACNICVYLLLILPLTTSVASGSPPAKNSRTNVAALEFFALHPHAPKKGTAGEKIRALCRLPDGNVLPLFGDWTANTGAMEIYSLDPLTGLWQHNFTFGAHAARVCRYGPQGRMIVPATQRAGSPYHDFMAVSRDNLWSGASPLAATHLFDIEYTDGHIFLAGSLGKNAVIWRCDNHLSSCRTVLVEEPDSGAYSRFYFVLLTDDGKLRTQKSDFYGNNTGARPISASYESEDGGASWSLSGPNILRKKSSVRRSVRHGGYFYLIDRHEGDGSDPLRVSTKDGSSRLLKNKPTRAFYSDGIKLYRASWRKVYVFDNKWRTIATTAPSDPAIYSLFIRGNKVFTGMGNGEVWQAEFAP